MLIITAPIHNNRTTTLNMYTKSSCHKGILTPSRTFDVFTAHLRFREMLINIICCSVHIYKLHMFLMGGNAY